MDGSMKKICSLILAILLASSLPAVAEEGPQVDFVLLIDTSLSMASAMEDLKKFVATNIVGRFVQQSDWVAVIAFYGKSTLIWEGDIRTEADKAALVRSLHALEATGRFTDIGAALDEMKQLVIKRNKPEIPKYILLLTDEVQEAPPGSEYISDDFTVSHELLEYVRRVDLGSFQAITIGYGLASRIESDLESLMKTLNDPPDRPERFLPGSSSVQTQNAASLGTPPGLQGGIDPAASGTAGSAAAGSTPSGNPTDTTYGTGSRSGGGIQLPVMLILALVMGSAILVALVLIILGSKKTKSLGKPPGDKEKDNPSGLKDGKQ